MKKSKTTTADQPEPRETQEAASAQLKQAPKPSDQKQATAEAPKSREIELLEQLQRLQAEFDNYRKRVDAENTVAADRSQEKLLKDLLVIVDSLNLAVKHQRDGEASEDAKELRTALMLIHSQFSQFLEQHEVQAIRTDGVVDPRYHEVYSTDTSDKPAGTILEVFQQGYSRRGTVLRTAKVKAARG